MDQDRKNPGLLRPPAEGTIQQLLQTSAVQPATAGLFADGYLCRVNDALANPVYAALLSGDKRLSFGTENIKFFDEKVSPFVGFEGGDDKGFDDLFELLPAGRVILFATPQHIRQPRGWQLLHKAKGLQMIYVNDVSPAPLPVKPVHLQEEHIEQMMQLAKLTKPGPFGLRTIDFGHYHGIFEGGHLAAMAGQRLHVQQFTEISAVCTHPDHLGKGYASALVQHQVGLILGQKKTPFLHVRRDNQRAIDVYQRLGFAATRPMNFYFMKRRSRKMRMPTPSSPQSETGTEFTAELSDQFTNDD